MPNETPYEYWKLNREKDIDIFHDSISGVTLTGTQVIRITQGAADGSSRFVQAKQFGHIIPAKEDEYETWLKFKWDMDHPEPVVEVKPGTATEIGIDPGTQAANPGPIPTEEELLDLTKPELLATIKASKKVTKEVQKEWEKLSSEEIVPLYLAILNP